MSKLSVWIDNVTTDNVQGVDAFTSDSQRQNGFKAGTGASAIRVNTALRQANLIAVALMNCLGLTNNDNISVQSALSDVETWIRNTSLFKLSDVLMKSDVGNVQISGILYPPENTNVDIGFSNRRFNAIYAQAIDAVNFTANSVVINDTLDGRTASAEFDSLKVAQQIDGDISGVANSATNYAPGGNIASKFSALESRLNNLGFKGGAILFAGLSSGTLSSSDIYRQGNIVWGKISGKITITQAILQTYFYEGAELTRAVRYGETPQNTFYPTTDCSMHIELVEDTSTLATASRIHFTLTFKEGTDVGVISDYYATGVISGETFNVNINFGYVAQALNI